MPRPLRKTEMSIGRNRKLKVYVYRDHGGPAAASRQKFEAGKCAYGCCVYHPKTGNAEIHLALPYMGAGLFAHELQHLMLHEAERRSPFGDEELPNLAERITKKFWIWFYKHFTQERKQKD